MTTPLAVVSARIGAEAQYEFTRANVKKTTLPTWGKLKEPQRAASEHAFGIGLLAALEFMQAEGHRFTPRREVALVTEKGEKLARYTTDLVPRVGDVVFWHDGPKPFSGQAIMRTLHYEEGEERAIVILNEVRELT